MEQQKKKKLGVVGKRIRPFRRIFAADFRQTQTRLAHYPIAPDTHCTSWLLERQQTLPKRRHNEIRALETLV